MSSLTTENTRLLTFYCIKISFLFLVAQVLEFFKTDFFFVPLAEL